MLKSQPIILISIIVLVLLSQPYMPLSLQQVFYAVSLTLKSGIIFVLPIIIFNLLFKTMVNLTSRATAVITMILLCVMCSNFMAAYLSHYVGMLLSHVNFHLIAPEALHELQPAWQFVLPKLVNNNVAMFAGIILGILLGRYHETFAQQLAIKLDCVTHVILKMLQIIIPVFVAGFIVKLEADGVINVIIKDYALIFAIVACAQCCYLLFAYLAVNKFNVSSALACLSNMMPAAIAGFSAMSSAAVMPLTLEGVAANTENKTLAKSIVPSTVNIHLLGDCIAIPIFAYALMSSFGLPMPSFSAYLMFTCFFVLAKFSVAAVPGGGILVMLPVLENYLGFNAAMLSMMTALYILFDPVVTSANVLGNGIFAKFVADRVIGRGA